MHMCVNLSILYKCMKKKPIGTSSEGIRDNAIKQEKCHTVVAESPNSNCRLHSSWLHVPIRDL